MEIQYSFYKNQNYVEYNGANGGNILNVEVRSRWPRFLGWKNLLIFTIKKKSSITELKTKLYYKYISEKMLFLGIIYFTLLWKKNTKKELRHIESIKTQCCFLINDESFIIIFFFNKYTIYITVIIWILLHIVKQGLTWNR